MSQPIAEFDRVLPQSQAWWILIAGWSVMFVPVYYRLAMGLWQTDDQSHAPLILLIAFWLLWELRHRLAQIDDQPANAMGAAVFLFGIFLFILGRTQEILLFEVGSQIPIVAGAFLTLSGPRMLRLAWFPVMFLVFMIPLPGPLVDLTTGALKQWVSHFTEVMIRFAGYPISRSGVVLHIGQYDLMVADACSGIHSMYSLAALGALYLYMAKRTSRLHNAIMLAAILPVAFAANVIRVMILVLLTYHFGDAAGQGFLHGFAGIVLMVASLAFLLLLDQAMLLVIPPRSGPAAGT